MLLDEPGDATAPKGTRPWCLAVYDNACSQKKDTKFAVSRLKRSLLVLRDGDNFRQLHDANKQPFVLWEDFVRYREPFGLGMKPEVAEAIIREPDQARLLGDVMAEATREEKTAERAAPDGVPAAAKNGGDRSGEQVAISYLLPKGSTSAARITARIKRDRPDIAARMAAGEFPSAQAAARAAGIAPKSADGLGKPETLANRILARGPDYADAVVAAILKGKK